jgi:hypothetical protein
MSNQKSPDLGLLYQENAKIAAIFWKWRHKIMTGLFAIIVALFALSGWFYQQRFGEATAVPLFFGFILCFTAVLLDWRNARILKACYFFGQKIEKEVGEDNGIFTLINEARITDNGSQTNTPLKWLIQKLTYTILLRVIYLLMGILLLGLSYVAYYHPLKPAAPQINVEGSVLQQSSNIPA